MTQGVQRVLLLLAGALVGAGVGAWALRPAATASGGADVRVPLRSDGAEVVFSAAGASAQIEVQISTGVLGAVEVGPLIPAGRVAEAWRIDPERRVEREVPGTLRFEVKTVPGASYALRILPIPMAMGEGAMPTVHVRVRCP